ncbi:hypothetical protein HN51_049257 [Arachis hypogaea]|uniref:uncharacterized protein n=1 Tax=Arachis hypogaea TaxID=3818 RepID=UPI0007AF6887|nr:uncharacterized protein LOC107606428 isoform X2 [Arachis ipaensis]XP_025666621.1 uncharacterized protein LOC112764978 [Arachis hypogaea]QHN90946.1 uncharacterized protein DS421_17g570770 [Arachis hypogaea]
MSNVNPNPERVLAIPVKKSDPVGLYRPLRKFVATKYSESDAQKVESILETLNNCRRDMVERGDLSLPMQRDCLVHYFKCLCMVEPLFTAISSDADADPIIFVWYDAFSSERENGVSSQRNSIQLEKAAVIFNLGAICSQIGASCDRTTALGRHLAMDAFNAAANFFYKLWKVFAKDVSATLDLTLLFAESLHRLFSAQASELNLQQRLHHNNTNEDASSAQQQHQCAVGFESVSKLYRMAFDLILSDSAATKLVGSFDESWITHLSRKVKFFEGEARQRQSSILPNSKRPKTLSLVQSCRLDHDAESVTEKLVRGICCMISLLQSCLDHDVNPVLEKNTRKFCKSRDMSIPKHHRIPYLDLLLSEYSSFKIIDNGKLVSSPWNMPPPYPINLAILSASSFSDMLAIPLKKSEPLDLYHPLHSYVALEYSESEAKRVEGLFQMLHKLRSEMQRDDLSLPIRRDCLIRYFKCLCMVEPLFPMTNSPSPPIFVWYNAFNPQENSSQHNIHLEKASVLFNLGALCTHITLSCDLTTDQGLHLAVDTLNDASYWFFILWKHEAEKASATIDLSVNCVELLREIITAQIDELKWNYPPSHCNSHSYRSSLPAYPVAQHYRKAYDMSTFGPLAENLVQSSIPQFLESKKKTCLVKTGSSVTEQFLLGYCEAQSLLQEGCQTSCLDLFSVVGSFKIKDGNLVANLRGSNVAIVGDEVPGDHTTTVTSP